MGEVRGVDSPQVKNINLGENSVTAAAQILSRPGARTVRFPLTTRREWQREIWSLSKLIPELGFYLAWHHAAASRVRLQAAQVVPGARAPRILDEGPIAEAVTHFAGGPAPAGALLARAAVHIQATGETYTVFGTTDPENPGDVQTYSDQEIYYSANRWQVDTGDGVGPRDLPFSAHVVRAWEPDFTYFSQPYSAILSSLPVLRELHSLTMLVAAEADSRLSAGIMFWPESAAFPGGLKAFINDLLDQLATPIHDRSSAASVVPLPVSLPDDAIEKIRHIRFGMELSEQTQPLREESLRRFARAARIPSEVVTGMGEVTHWGQWFIDEQGIRLFIAPAVHVILHAWTIGWLQPLLETQGIENAEDYIIWPDFSQLTLRPDRSADAVSLYDRFVLSQKALLRETGFDAADAPTEEELFRQVLLSIAREAPTAAESPLILLFGDKARNLNLRPEVPGRPPEGGTEVPFDEAGGEPVSSESGIPSTDSPPSPSSPATPGGGDS